ncbi:MAG TPA: DUF4097 family beta strand repeat-containing protein [Gemmatimonadaceae bacterium]|nr:DUF4097 family beta strand repeat-containing protein [Gemmatimonadaceae bacterium]
MSIRMGGFLAAVALAPAAMAGAQRSEQTSDFRWSERIEAGRTVKTTGINGTITYRQGSGDRVEVTAVKRWRRGDPASVRILATKDGGDIRVCPLYEDQDDCDDHNSRGRRDRDRRDYDNDVSVDFTVTVPRGVHVVAGSINGAVSITGATEDVEAATVNGDVRVESGRGRLSATTVQGNVVASVRTRPSAMEFTTVNGSVIVEMASGIGADIDLTTVNGDLRSDYDVMVRGRFDPYNVRAHVGPAGGPRMRVTTVNGAIELRKR